MSTAEFDFRLLLETLPDAVLACNAAGRVVFANASVERLLGWSAAELVGHPLDLVIPERLREAHQQGLSRFLQTHQARIMGRAVRLSALNRDGQEVEIELTLSNVQADGEVLLIGSLRDMRERLELQRQTTLTQYLKVTARMATLLGDLVDLDTIVQTVAQTLVGDLNAALAQVWLVEPSNGSLSLKATSGFEPNPFPNPGLDPSSDSSEIALAAQRREPVVVARNWLSEGRTGSLATFPLVSGGGLRGVLVFGSSLSLDSEVLDALSALSAIVAAAINDNLVLSREQAARLEAEVERKRLQAILDTISAGVLLAEGPEGCITVLNPAGNHLLGLNPLP
ncbi:MAG TPA: PAS domain S-box protein, partial [Isosphaeraceae bacterium]|nr:PAS domain S-box protein [Isosphaeraceae bacterium]